MKSKRIQREEGKAMFILVFNRGDEVLTTLQTVAVTQSLSGSNFTAIGAFSDVTLGFFDMERRDYQKILLNEQVEVLSLSGNIAIAGHQPRIHAHAVVGKRDGTAHGGHLLEAHVRPTLEVVLTESPANLQRVSDEETGLALLRV